MADVTSPFGFPYPEPTDLVRDGATDIEALAQAANDQFSAGFQFAGQRIYTSSGQFVKADPLGTGDIGLRAIRVRMVGGGGGGGGAATTGSNQNANAGGGGGAAFAESFLTDIGALPSSVTVTRGAGGTGGGAGNNAGSAGGQSSFDALVTAAGGGGAQGRVVRPANDLASLNGNPGTSGTGQLIVPGRFAGGIRLSPITTSSITHGPAGGASFLGGEAPPPFTDNGENGNNGVGFGSGGSGGANADNQSTARSGGSGSNGIIIVEVFV